MEHTSIDSDVELYKFHSGAPSDDAYIRAAQELIESANALLAKAVMDKLELESVTRPAAVPPGNPQRLIGAYSNALREHARKNPKIVALDADLILDTGLIPFQSEFPDRFVECGIAEQDMVSQAGGMALQGLLPIVHSFACFLSARPNEQIYTNASEQKKIIYVGSLAGVVPGGPGHSHQAVRDISALAAIPGLTLMEPSCEEEVAMLLEWAINTNKASSYLRLVSLPSVIPYHLPAGYIPERGKGVALTEGEGVAVISSGPVMLSSAVQAARKIESEQGVNVRVINLPWLNEVDTDWLKKALTGCTKVLSVDNHYLVGGQGDRIADIIATSHMNVILQRLALRGIPACGTNPEILDAHGMDVAGIEQAIGALLRITNNSAKRPS